MKTNKEKIEEVLENLQEICEEWAKIVNEHIMKNKEESSDSINDYIMDAAFDDMFSTEVRYAVDKDIEDDIKIVRINIGAVGDIPDVVAEYYIELVVDGETYIISNKEF